MRSAQYVDEAPMLVTLSVFAVMAAAAFCIIFKIFCPSKLPQASKTILNCLICIFIPVVLSVYLTIPWRRLVVLAQRVLDTAETSPPDMFSIRVYLEVVSAFSISSTIFNMICPSKFPPGCRTIVSWIRFVVWVLFPAAILLRYLSSPYVQNLARQTKVPMFILTLDLLHKLLLIFAALFTPLWMIHSSKLPRACKTILTCFVFAIPQCLILSTKAQSPHTPLISIVRVLPLVCATILPIASATILEPSKFPHLFKKIIVGHVVSVIYFFPVSILVITILAVSLFAFRTFLGFYSAFVGQKCSVIYPFYFRRQRTWAHYVFKIVLGTRLEMFPVVSLLGFASSLTLFLVIVYQRHKHQNHLDYLLAESRETEINIADTKDTIQECERQLADVDATLVCLICVDRLTQPYTLAPCGHTFDLACLQGWFRSAHPSPADEELALTFDRRGSVYTLLRQKFCPICRTEVRGCPVPARALLGAGLGVEFPGEGVKENMDVWYGLFGVMCGCEVCAGE
ncbi:hypothetical protein B0H19DRAFT_1077395 [Mycena capillaripes]|nr:hypothetical protein B0H19DRAFT_1077395 [Mycena capillaripes]